MSVKKFYSNKAKPGWRWDERKKQYASWGYEFWEKDASKKYGRRRVTEHGFATRELADRALARIKIDEKRRKHGFVEPPETRIKLFDLCQRRLETIENEKEQIRAHTVLQRWLDLLPDNLSLSDVKTSDIRLYIEARAGDKTKRTGKPPKASSVNREITIIAATLHAAKELFPELEDWTVPEISRPKVSRSRRERLITASEILRVLTVLFAPQAAGESIADYNRRITVGQVFRFALLTGARVGELIGMRWEQIDWQAGIVQIVGTKNQYKTAATVRYLDMTPTMREILEQRRGALESESEFVFSRNGCSITRYHQVFRAACDEAGVKYGQDVAGGFVTHDARHTAVTRMLQAGIDLSTVGSITGHSDKHLILHYSHATRESRAKAVNVLEDFAGEQIKLEIKPQNGKNIALKKRKAG